MTFTKGNQLWRKGLEARKKQKNKLQAFLDNIADGGLRDYGEKLADLGEGKALSKPEAEFMDRFEGWREYVAPKLARSETKTELTGEIKLTWDD